MRSESVSAFCRAIKVSCVLGGVSKVTCAEEQLCVSVGCDFKRLQQPTAVTGEDEDLVVLRHHSVPVARLGEGGRLGAVRKCDDIGQRSRRLIVADDNQCGDEYDPPDHSSGQDRHQSPQETQVGRFRGLIFGGVVHV